MKRLPRKIKKRFKKLCEFYEARGQEYKKRGENAKNSSNDTF